MKLSIFSLKSILFQGNAKSINCTTNMGQITVLDNHETLITTLSGGIVKVVDEKDNDHIFPVAAGFLEVKPGNEVRIIVESK